MHWDYALLLVFIGVAVPLLGRRRIRQLLEAPDLSSLERVRLYASTIAFQWLISALVLWRIHAHGVSAAALGLALSHPALSVAIGSALSLLLLLNQLFSLARLAKHPPDPRAIVPRMAAKVFPRTPSERLAFIPLVVTVAVCEEWIFRGFVQHVFADWAGGLEFAGVLASAALFGFAHLYQGRRGVLSTGLLGAVFSFVRAWTGWLLPTIAAHFVADLAVGLLAPSRIAAATSIAAAGSGDAPSPPEPQDAPEKVY